MGQLTLSDIQKQVAELVMIELERDELNKDRQLKVLGK